MGLENVLKDILEQARAEVAAINEAAAGEAESTIRAAQVQADEIVKTRKAETENQKERMHRQEMSSAHLELKRTILNAKKEVLDRVYEAGRDSISSMPAQENAELLKVILDKYSGSGTRVYSSGKDAKLVREMTELTFMGEIDCLGGLIIENDDGSIRLDYTFDTILANVWEKNLKHISDILFG